MTIWDLTAERFGEHKPGQLYAQMDRQGLKFVGYNEDGKVVRVFREDGPLKKKEVELTYQKIIHVDDKEAWLAERAYSVGASDQLDDLSAKRKVGLAEPFEGNVHTEAGQELESAILAWWCKRTQIACEPCGWLLRREDTPWMHATLDGWSESEKLVVEIKNVGLNKADAWLKMGKVPQRRTAKDTVTGYQQAVLAAEVADTPPIEYWAQVQQQLYITGWDKAYLVGLIGGKRLIQFDIRRNEGYIHSRIEHCRAFMQKVETLRKEQNND